MKIASIKKLIMECWSHNPSARLTSLYVKRAIMELKSNRQFNLYNIDQKI